MCAFLNKVCNKKILFGVLVMSLFLLFTSVTFAAAKEYQPLVGIPGITNLGKDTTMTQYINALYTLTITVGVLLGVMRIAWAGVKYSLSDVVTDKESAKSDIRGVLLGLAILLLPFIVLSTINPNLVNLEVFKNPPKSSLSAPSNSDTGPAAGAVVDPTLGHGA